MIRGGLSEGLLLSTHRQEVRRYDREKGARGKMEREFHFRQ